MGKQMMSPKIPGYLGKYQDSHNRGCMWVVAFCGVLGWGGGCRGPVE